jgi:NAD(P)-dependent dehydrogenase (short-subunit alcohol dehydrogenase family)
MATAKLFVEEGAYRFITGRRTEKLEEAVETIGGNVKGVQGDASNLNDLDRLYETVRRDQGKIDILFASAGFGEFAKIGRNGIYFEAVALFKSYFSVAAGLFCSGVCRRARPCRKMGTTGTWRLN